MTVIRESNAEKRIISHTVFITAPKSKTVGSGVLIKLAGRDFVFSAAHVIDGEVNISLGLHLPQTPFTVLRKGIDQDRDVGYVELKPSEVLFLRGEKNSEYPVSVGKTVKAAWREPVFAISGFPNFGAKQHPDRVEYSVTLLRVPIFPPDQWPDGFAESLDPATSLLIPFGPQHKGEFTNRNGLKIHDPDPRGFSGAGVWYLDKESEDSDAPQYSLVGIQRAWDRRKKVLYVSKVETLVNLICRDYNITVPKA